MQTAKKKETSKPYQRQQHYLHNIAIDELKYAKAYDTQKLCSSILYVKIGFICNVDTDSKHIFMYLDVRIVRFGWRVYFFLLLSTVLFTPTYPLYQT